MESRVHNSGPGRYVAAGAFVTALVGLADAAYLTSKHLSGAAVPCSLVSGCEVVLTSAWAEIFGIPTALFGAIAYFAAFSISFLVFYGRKNLWPLFGLLSAAMFLFSLWLIYLQAWVIGAFCQYCLVSALTSTVLFSIFLASVFLRKRDDSMTS